MSEITAFGKWLSRTRKSKGMRQQDLSEASHISRTYISNLECGCRSDDWDHARTPSRDTVDRLCRALGVPIEDGRLAAGYAVDQMQSGATTVLMHGGEATASVVGVDVSPEQTAAKLRELAAQHAEAARMLSETADRIERMLSLPLPMPPISMLSDA